jgi:hypothetical protein
MLILSQGGHSLSNRATRFKDQPEATPGPGTYTLSKKADWIKEVGRPGAQSTTSQLESEKGSVVRSHALIIIFITCSYLNTMQYIY